LRARGAAFSHPRTPAETLVKLGLRTLVLRHIVSREGSDLTVNPGQELVLTYYANSIAHLAGE
jgi:hypothetical protein